MGQDTYLNLLFQSLLVLDVFGNTILLGLEKVFKNVIFENSLFTWQQ